MKRGLLVTLLHLLIVLSLGGKLMVDRVTRPRVWIRAGSFSPNLPIRGRYIALNTRVRAPWIEQSTPGKYRPQWAALSAGDHELVATRSDVDTGVTLTMLTPGTAQLSGPMLYFLPEHANDPSWLKPGEELWVEVTLPRRGPPRPIQLAVKDAQGEWHPLRSR